jgi:hypothetical protein
MRFYFVISSLRREIYKLKGAFNFVELLIERDKDSNLIAQTVFMNYKKDYSTFKNRRKGFLIKILKP